MGYGNTRVARALHARCTLWLRAQPDEDVDKSEDPNANNYY